MSTAINLGDAINRTSRATGLSQAASHPERSLMVGWYNEAVDQFLVETKMITATASMAVTAGSADYTLDTSLIAIKDLWYDPADGSTDFLMIPEDESEIIRRRILQASVAASPERYALSGANLLMLWPTPVTTGDKIHVLYVGHAASAMSADAHSPDTAAYGGIPVEWHPVLLDYLMWKAAIQAKDEASGNGQVYMQAWMSGLARAKSRTTRKAGVRVPRAVPGGRDRSWRRTASPGVDLGN